MFEQQSEPFWMFEGAGLGIAIEFLEALGHAVQTERMQLFERGMGEHSSSPSVEVARTANVGMIEQHRFGAALGRRNTIKIVVENRSDAFVGHRADFERAGRDRL